MRTSCFFFRWIVWSMIVGMGLINGNVKLWSIDINERKWDVSGYHTYSKWQKKSAEEIVEGYAFRGNEQVLDLCCGDGKVSAYMASLIPTGSVLGIDISLDMITFAHMVYRRPNLEFRLYDARKLDFTNQFDLATSFTSMHLIDDQVIVLKCVYNSLKKGGRLIMQFPIVHGFGKALERVLLDSKWQKFFANFSPGWYFYSLDNYVGFLKESHLRPIRLEVTTIDEVYPSSEAFQKSISYWLPHLNILPAPLKQSFLNDLVFEYLKEKPLDKQGQLHYSVDRLEVEAVKDE